MYSRPSDHYDSGRKDDVKYIVIHSTEGTTLEGALHHLNKVGYSVHYIVDEHGGISQLVDEKNTAWHVGKIANPFSIGIEIVGVSSKPGFIFNKEQYESASLLSAYLINTYHLLPEKVAPHSYITKTNGGTTHQDPGPNFDWKNFNQEMEKKLESDIVVIKK